MQFAVTGLCFTPASRAVGGRPGAWGEGSDSLSVRGQQQTLGALIGSWVRPALATQLFLQMELSTKAQDVKQGNAAAFLKRA